MFKQFTCRRILFPTNWVACCCTSRWEAVLISCSEKVTKGATCTWHAELLTRMINDYSKPVCTLLETLSFPEHSLWDDQARQSSPLHDHQYCFSWDVHVIVTQYTIRITISNILPCDYQLNVTFQGASCMTGLAWNQSSSIACPTSERLTSSYKSWYDWEG